MELSRLFSLFLCIVGAAKGSPIRSNGTESMTTWVELGPFNIFNAADGHGQTGTVADAASPQGKPETIYVGGQNNAAASGIMKTTDYGRTWQQASNGLSDPRIWSLFIDPSDDNHLMTGTPSGVFESSDAGMSWSLRSETVPWMGVRQFVLATIGDSQFILGSAQAGIIHRPVGSNDPWSIYPKPNGLDSIGWMSDCVKDSSAGNTVCYVMQVPGNIWRLSVSSTGDATWSQTRVSGNTVTVDPGNVNRILFTDRNDYSVHESTDGGQSGSQISTDAAWYIRYDNRNTIPPSDCPVPQKCFADTHGSKGIKVIKTTDTDVCCHACKQLPTCAGYLIAPKKGLCHLKAQASHIKSGCDPSRTTCHPCALANAAPPQRLLWKAGQGNMAWSSDGGHTWNGPLSWSTKSATPGNDVVKWSGFDHQRILFGVGNNYVGTCTDQGLFLWSGGTEVQSVGGTGLGLTIAIGPAIANGNSHIITTMWDRGPTASWDGGKTWPATAWYGSQWWQQPGAAGAPADVGEGGYAKTLGNGGMHVFIYQARKPGQYWHSSDGGLNFNSNGLTFPNSGSVDVSYNPFDYARGSDSQPTGRAYIIADAAILQSDDFGETWSTSSFPSPPVDTPRSLAVDPTNPSNVWVVGANGISRWDGNSWSARASPGSKQDYRELHISPTDSSKMLLIVNGATPMRTTDSGASWSGVTDSDVNAATTACNWPCKTVGAYSFSGKTIAVSMGVTTPAHTAVHVFKSQDDGASWTDQAGGNLLTVQINSVSWNGGDLILGTSGQGIVKGVGFDSVSGGVNTLFT